MYFCGDLYNTEPFMCLRYALLSKNLPTIRLYAQELKINLRKPDGKVKHKRELTNDILYEANPWLSAMYPLKDKSKRGQKGNNGTITCKIYDDSFDIPPSIYRDCEGCSLNVSAVNIFMARK